MFSLSGQCNGRLFDSTFGQLAGKRGVPAMLLLEEVSNMGIKQHLSLRKSKFIPQPEEAVLQLIELLGRRYSRAV